MLKYLNKKIANDFFISKSLAIFYRFKFDHCVVEDIKKRISK